MTKLDCSPFLVVRHALSNFNIAYKEYANFKGSTHDDFLDVWAGSHLIDACLHPEGIE